jgi:hypothetical protein
MNPWKVSAQFAAFVWFANRKVENKASMLEAAQFAKENWIAFLPYAHDGYGRLLIEIAKPRPRAEIGKSITPTTVSKKPALAR